MASWSDTISKYEINKSIDDVTKRIVGITTKYIKKLNTTENLEPSLVLILRDHNTGAIKNSYGLNNYIVHKNKN